jgi:rhodanese-related sulfurtransferase
MTPKNTVIFLYAGLVFILASCTTRGKKTENDSGKINVVVLEPEEFKSKLSSTPDAIIVDVRTPEEFSQGVIEGAINIDFKAPDFSEKVNALDKDKTYFVYCLSGKRSNSAIEMMEDAGFKKVYSLKDGLQHWTEEGLSTVQPQ